MLRKFHEKEGFTLIELMIVIAIIGILAAIAIPNFLAYRTRGQDSAAISAAKNFYNMAMAYYADGGTGTVTVANLPSYNEGDQVDAGGSINDTLGTISVTSLTFKHQDSSNVHTLKDNGDVSSPS